MRPLLALAAAASVALPAFVLAQSVDDGQTYPTPGEPNQLPVVPPSSEPGFKLPPVPEALSPPASAPSGAGQVFVKHIEVRGVKAFKPAAIRAIVARYENRQDSNADLESLRIALTRLYVDKGYINSGVILPDQAFKDGLVVYQAIEGTLTRVDVVGKTHLSRHYITSRVFDSVTQPLNISDLQYAVRYLQEDPNILKVDASLGPGDALGQSVLRVGAEDQPRFSAGIGVDDHHTPSTGETEGTAALGVRNLTGYGEDLHGTFAHTQGGNEGSAVFSIPLSANNASFQAYWSLANQAIVQKPFNQLNIDEKIRTYGLSFTVPLLNHLDNRFALFLGMESDRSSTSLLGTGFSFSPGAQSGVSATAPVQGGFDWQLRSKSSVTDFRVTYKRGVDALGATIYTPMTNEFGLNPNPTGADGRFGLEQLTFIHIQRLNRFSGLSHVNDRAQLVVRAAGQLSQNPLLIVEKYAIGGFDTVRGYSEDLLVRDNGANATVELQLPLPGYRAEPNWRDLAFAMFVDYGRSWDKVSTSPPPVDTKHPIYIVSAGPGLLWNPLRGLDAQAYWGRGIANNFNGNNPEDFQPNDLQKHGIHFALNYVYRW